MLRLLHTADWHLGHRLHDLPREAEQRAFLEWLLHTLEAERVDALLVAGDIFDTANPPNVALAAYYDFLSRARRRCPGLDVVIVGGNHDSATRLDAPAPVLDALGVRVVGGLPRLPDGALDLERLLVPLTDGSGTVAAWVAAVPFLRAADVPRGEEAHDDDDDPLIRGVAQIYAAILDAARSRRLPHQALVATGHCYMRDGRLSELSERKILRGNQHALPVGLFPDDLAYVALGHLHLAQSVGAREGVRYAGSPLPLSMAEADYTHQVMLVDLEGPRRTATRVLPVPRTVDLLRVPATGPAPLEEVLEALRALPERSDPPAHGAPELPFLEVRVRLHQPEPGLRRRLDEALEGRAARLVKITTHRTGDAAALADTPPAESLDALTHEEVFRRRYAAEFEGEPSPELLADFHELLEAALREAP